MSTVAENGAHWKPTLADLVSGKTVAVVGNAESIQGTGHGAAIDACDVVIRINKGGEIAENERPDVGSRTDAVYCCSTDFSKISQTADGPRICKVAMTILEWLRQRHYVSMIDGRICNPNTGTVLLMDLALSGARVVNIFGMDFFRSGQRKTGLPSKRIHAPEGFTIYHDFEQDRLMVRRLINWRNGLYRPDAAMGEALKDTDDCHAAKSAPLGFTPATVTERHECNVLQGAAKTIARDHPAIIIEELDKEQSAAISAILTPMGYRRQPLKQNNAIWTHSRSV